METILTNIQALDARVDNALDRVAKGSNKIQDQAVEIHEVAEELLSVISAQLLHSNKSKSLAGLPSSASKAKALKKSKIRVKGMSMQSIWGQIEYYNQKSNTNLIKNLKKLIQTPDITLQLDKTTNKNYKDQEGADNLAQGSDNALDENEYNEVLDEKDERDDHAGGDINPADFFDPEGEDLDLEDMKEFLDKADRDEEIAIEEEQLKDHDDELEDMYLEEGIPAEKGIDDMGEGDLEGSFKGDEVLKGEGEIDSDDEDEDVEDEIFDQMRENNIKR